MAILIASATIAFHFLEGWRVLDAFYFSVVTFMTVGYGDFTPTRDVTKLLTAFLVLFSIPMLFTVIGISSEAVFTSYVRATEGEKRRRMHIRAALRRRNHGEEK